MAVPSTATFLLRFPEFGEVLTSVVEGALAEATRFTPETVWTTWHGDGVSYLAAHLIATRTLQIGNQVGTTAGTPSGEQLAATQYGQAYQRLRDSLPITGFVV